MFRNAMQMASLRQLLCYNPSMRNFSVTSTQLKLTPSGPTKKHGEKSPAARLVELKKQAEKEEDTLEDDKPILSSDVIFPSNNKPTKKAQNISRAMQFYMEQLEKREKLMKSEIEEFNIGKRHLARIMGEDPNMFTSDKIDKSIEYLLPSGLFEPEARPFLKHPVQYFPKSKVAAFEIDGRPKNFMFYTKHIQYNTYIYTITQKLISLNKLEDALYLVKKKVSLKMPGNESDASAEKALEVQNEADTRMDLTGTTWIEQEELSNKLKVNIDEFHHKKFILLLQKLADHKYSKKEQSFIQQFLKPLQQPITLSNIEALKTDKDGRGYQIVTAKQRTATVTVRLYEGTGKIEIKAPEGNFNINFFENLYHREQILFPFKVVDRINKFDVSITVNNGGMSCLAKAMRYAISKCLCSFVPADSAEKLRLAGLLTYDHRPKERKKPGQEGARRRDRKSVV